jgi:DNA (cytosine-5)-methyltransferase 1
MPIQAVDLFCGIGGLTHGITQAGIPVVAGIDIDSTCEFAYTHNNGALFVLSDVGTYPSENITNFYDPESTKVLMGCAPCQPFSKLQKNEQDKTKESKWGLLYSFLDHIRNVNPEIVSMENVPALNKEIVFRDFVNELENLGYHVSHYIVDASDYGVAQRRKRLLLLASRLGQINLIEPTHKNNKFTVQMAIGDLPTIKNGQTHHEDFLHRAAKLSKENLKRIRASKPGGTWKDWDYNLLPECYKRETGKSYSSVYGRMRYDDVAPTLTTQFNRYGTGRYGHPVQDRAISLREGAILQSFPLNYKFVENENYNLTDIARQIGNAVPVRLGEVIGLSILEHLRGLGINE